MNIGEVQEYKLEIGKKTYTFRLDFEALCKLEDKYDNSLQIINDYLSQKKQFSNLTKILSCACVEKDWKEEELRKSLSFNFPAIKIIDMIGIDLIKGSLVLDKKEEKNDSPKNKQTSQGKK